MAEYRVRESVVEFCNGYTCRKGRGFLAERRVSVLGIFSFWWPCHNSDWRTTPEEAQRDAQEDVELRLPLAAPKLFEIK